MLPSPLRVAMAEIVGIVGIVILLIPRSFEFASGGNSPVAKPFPDFICTEMSGFLNYSHKNPKLWRTFVREIPNQSALCFYMAEKLNCTLEDLEKLECVAQPAVAIGDIRFSLPIFFNIFQEKNRIRMYYNYIFDITFTMENNERDYMVTMVLESEAFTNRRERVLCYINLRQIYQIFESRWSLSNTPYIFTPECLPWENIENDLPIIQILYFEGKKYPPIFAVTEHDISVKIGNDEKILHYNRSETILKADFCQSNICFDTTKRKNQSLHPYPCPEIISEEICQEYDYLNCFWEKHKCLISMTPKRIPVPTPINTRNQVTKNVKVDDESKPNNDHQQTIIHKLSTQDTIVLIVVLIVVVLLVVVLTLACIVSNRRTIEYHYPVSYQQPQYGNGGSRNRLTSEGRDDDMSATYSNSQISSRQTTNYTRILSPICEDEPGN